MNRIYILPLLAALFLLNGCHATFDLHHPLTPCEQPTLSSNFNSSTPATTSALTTREDNGDTANEKKKTQEGEGQPQNQGMLVALVNSSQLGESRNLDSPDQRGELGARLVSIVNTNESESIAQINSYKRPNLIEYMATNTNGQLKINLNLDELRLSQVLEMLLPYIAGVGLFLLLALWIMLNGWKAFLAIFRRSSPSEPLQEEDDEEETPAATATAFENAMPFIIFIPVPVDETDEE